MRNRKKMSNLLKLSFSILKKDFHPDQELYQTKQRLIWKQKSFKLKNLNKLKRTKKLEHKVSNLLKNYLK